MNSFLGHAHGIKDEVVERLDTIAHKLEEVHAATDALQKREEQLRVNTAVNGIPAGGMLTATLPNDPSAGLLWVIERVATTVTNPDGTRAAGSVNCELYLDDTNPSNLVEVIAGAQLYADAASNNIFVPEGRTLIARFSLLPATQVNCTVALQVKRMRVPGRSVHGQYSMGDW